MDVISGLTLRTVQKNREWKRGERLFLPRQKGTIKKLRLCFDKNQFVMESSEKYASSNPFRKKNHKIYLSNCYPN